MAAISISLGSLREASIAGVAPGGSARQKGRLEAGGPDKAEISVLVLPSA
jgi:hypothetical protein